MVEMDRTNCGQEMGVEFNTWEQYKTDPLFLSSHPLMTYKPVYEELLSSSKDCRKG